MKKILISAGAVAALALTSAPAAAAPVSATANAKAKIFKPLSLNQVSGADLDFATIVLGAGSYTSNVVVDQTGALTSCGANLTCSGTTAAAKFKATGTSNATLSITLPSSTVSLTDGVTGDPSLTVTLDAPTTANLGSAGPTTGVTFGVGGSLSVPSTTPDNFYSGTFTVNADYQ